MSAIACVFSTSWVVGTNPNPNPKPNPDPNPNPNPNSRAALNDLFQGIQLLRVLSWIHCILLFITLPVGWALVSDKSDRNSLRAAAVGFLYSYSFFFIALLPNGGVINLQIGPFVTMLMKVLTDDILKVGIIYYILLSTFSLVVWLCRGDVEDPNDDFHGFDSWAGTAESMVFITLGDFEDFRAIESFSAPRTAKVAAYIFLILTSILLLNLLIALLTDTYHMVRKDNEKVFRAGWARLVHDLEIELRYLGIKKEGFPIGQNFKMGDADEICVWITELPVRENSDAV